MPKLGKKKARISELESELANALKEIDRLKEQLAASSNEPQEDPQFFEDVKKFWDSMKKPQK